MIKFFPERERADIYSIALSPDSQYLYTGENANNDGKIQIYKKDGNAFIQQQIVGMPTAERVNRIATGGDYIAFAGGYKNTGGLLKRDGDTHRMIGVFDTGLLPNLSAGSCQDIKCSSDGKYIAILQQHISGSVNRYLRGTALRVNQDETITSLGSFASCSIGTDSSIGGIAITPDGQYIVVPSVVNPNYGPILFKMNANGTGFSYLLHVFDGDLGQSMVVDMAYSPDGALLVIIGTINNTPTIAAFKQTGDRLTRLINFFPEQPSYAMHRISFSPDGHYLITSMSGIGKNFIWIYAIGETQARLISSPEVYFDSYAFSVSGVFSPEMDAMILGMTSISPNSDTSSRGSGYYLLGYKTTVISPHPSGGFINPNADNAFTWDVRSGYSALFPAEQRAAVLHWRVQSESAYSEVPVASAEKSLLIPAGTFPTGVIEYRIWVQKSDGSWIDTMGWITLSTTDSISTFVPVSPVDIIINTDQASQFAWRHENDTGTPQAGVELQYSLNGGAWVTFYTSNGNEQSAIIPANTIPPGNLRWRGRTKNTDDAWGDWSSPAAFLGSGAPLVPIITSVAVTNRPTVHWQSAGQIAFDLRISTADEFIYQTGEIAGATKQFTLPLYILNGNYTAQLRVKNEDQRWSDYATFPFTIAMAPPSPPVISGSASSGAVTLTIESVPGDAENLYIFRDGLMIGRINPTQTQYVDYYALGPSAYFMRAVTSGQAFADSNTVNLVVRVPCAQILVVDDPRLAVTLNMKAQGEPAINRQRQYVQSNHQYTGREYPVVTFGEFATEQHSFNYYFNTRSEWERLNIICDRRRTVLYRDLLGNRFFGVITQLSDTQHESGDGARYSVSLSLQRADHVEEIAYEGVGT